MLAVALEAFAEARDHGQAEVRLGGKVVMHGGVFHAQFLRDVGVTEAAEAVLLQQRLRLIEDARLGVLVFCCQAHTK